MKTSSIVFLAVAVMSGLVSSAFAEDRAISPPDINGKLDALVEHKMDKLMERRESIRDQAGETEELTRVRGQLREVNHDTFIYVVSDNRS